MSDDLFIAAAADIAARVSEGGTVPVSIPSMMRAIVSTRAEADRHAMANKAESLAGVLTDVAIRVLRVGIFGL